MVAESGARLLDPDAQAALVALILPRAMVVTPNLPEARALAGVEPGAGDQMEMQALARAIHQLGPAAVVITGGHRDEAIDTLFDGEDFTEITGERYADGAAHGSGCTHSSALAAHLAHGMPLEAAVRAARLVAAASIRDGLRGVGQGPGPVDVLTVTTRAPRSSRI
jgi:hydroxymethylpyrimidine/phosphomethylpyrimidine kinase